MYTAENIGPIDAEQIHTLAQNLTGQVIQPADAEYDEARAVWNGMIDNYPALIVRCRNTQDVVTAVNFAREQNLPVSVRGGGHNAAGSAVRNDALVIDLSEMSAVTVDPQARIVRAEGGTTLGELDAATQKHALAVPAGVVSETGVAGLTLGGGVGWLRRKYGLTCDNLIGAEVVTSDGKVLTVSEGENSDLLWALRGGGGQFGVVTRFDYRAYPVGPQIMFVFVMHPADNPKQALQFYRDYIATAPDEVSSIAVLGHVPPEEHFPEAFHNQMFVLFGAAFAGDPHEGEKIVQPLRDYATPIVDFSDIMPYVEMQQTWDADYPSGELHYYWRSAYLDALSDGAIDALIEQTEQCPSVLSTIDIWHMGGAIRNFNAETSAFGQRDMNFLIGIEANWEDPAADDANVAWGRNVAAALQPFASHRRYLNFPGMLEEADLYKAMFNDTADRVKAVKAKYDPMDLFRLK